MRLESFRSWLLAEGKAETTANLYSALIRAFFRTEENARDLTGDVARLHAAARSYDRGLRDRSRSAFRSSFRAFIRYAATKGQILNPGDERIFDDGRLTQPEGEAAPDEAAALGEVLRIVEKTQLPFSRIPDIRWRDVEGGAEGMALVYDRSNETHYEVPLEAIRALGYWASGGPRRPPGNLPLIPTAPRCLAPMPARRLWRITRGF